MHVLAAILDPADNGFDITDLGAVLGVIVVLAGIVGGVVKWVTARQEKKAASERADMERRIVEAVQLHTKPIQTTSNGGLSLPDVARNTDLIIERQTDIVRDVRAIRERLDDHIDTHNQKD